MVSRLNIVTPYLASYGTMQFPEGEAGLLLNAIAMSEEDNRSAHSILTELVNAPAGSGGGGRFYGVKDASGVDGLSLTLTPASGLSKIMLFFNGTLDNINRSDHTIEIRRGTTSVTSRPISASGNNNHEKQSVAIFELDEPETASEITYTVHTTGIGDGDLTNSVLIAYDDRGTSGAVQGGGSGGAARFDQAIVYILQEDTDQTPPVYDGEYSPALRFNNDSIGALDSPPASVPDGDLLWFIHLTAVEGSPTWTVEQTPATRAYDGYNIQFTSDRVTARATHQAGDTHVRYRMFNRRWTPWFPLGPEEWRPLWTHTDEYDTADNRVTFTTPMDLDALREIYFTVENRGYTGQRHEVRQTVPFRTENLELRDHGNTAFVREMRIAVGGPNQASALYSAGEINQISSWREFEGIDVSAALERADEVTTGRAAASAVFRARVGAYSRNVILTCYGR